MDRLVSLMGYQILSQVVQNRDRIHGGTFHDKDNDSLVS